MRRILTLTITTLVATGCGPIVPSLHPPATPEQLVVDPALAGYWQLEEEEEDGIYHLALSEEDPWMTGLWLPGECGEESIEFVAAKTVIEDGSFLIFTEDDSELIFSIPVFDTYRTEVSPDRIALSPLDEDWLTNLLESDPDALEVVWREAPSEPFGSNETQFERSLVVTASTPILRAFYGRHLDTEGAFEDPLVFVRLEDEEIQAFEQKREDC